MLEVAFVRSPYAHARLVGIRADAARALEDVALVVTGDEARRRRPRSSPARPGRRREPGAGRSSRATASATSASRSRPSSPRPGTPPRTRASSIEVDYEPLDAVVDPEQALTADAPLLHEHSNNFAHIEFEHGDVDDAFACAASVVAKRFHFGRTHAAPLEGRGGIADWSRDLTFWSSTQMPFLVRSMLAGLYGLPETQVRVLVPAVGGGFGLKVHLYVEEAILPFLSRLAGAPVKWAEDRYEHLAASGHSKEVVCDARARARRGRRRSSPSAGGWSATAARIKGTRGRA